MPLTYDHVVCPTSVLVYNICSKEAPLDAEYRNRTMTGKVTTGCLGFLFELAAYLGLTIGAPTRQNEGHVSVRFGDHYMGRPGSAPIHVFLDGEEAIDCYEAQASLPDCPGTVILLAKDDDGKVRHCSFCGDGVGVMRHGDVRIECELPLMRRE